MPSRRAISACVRTFAGLDEGLPLHRLPEEVNGPLRPWFQRPLGRSQVPRHRAHHSLGRHPARQGAHVAVLERPLGPQGDLDGLFEQPGHGDAVVAARGDV